MFKGRLGLDSGRIPYRERQGLLWLGRGKLVVEDGTLIFSTPGADTALRPGAYHIPFQGLTCILIEPGTTVSHDALRLLARHGTGLVAVGVNGVRMYSAAMPLGPDHSSLARKHAARWADPQARVEVARQMYALRLGELPPQRDLDSLRGFEGQRARHMYRLMADRFSIPWEGRRYDRQRPETSDQINQAINHAAVATRACAQVAVAAVGAIPQLGFIHEDSGISFPLDIADLYRDTVVLPAAFGAVAAFRKNPALEPLERAARRISGELLHDNKIVPEMIDAIKSLLHADDPGGDP